MNQTSLFPIALLAVAQAAFAQGPIEKGSLIRQPTYQAGVSPQTAARANAETEAANQRAYFQRMALLMEDKYQACQQQQAQKKTRENVNCEYWRNQEANYNAKAGAVQVKQQPGVFVPGVGPIVGGAIMQGTGGGVRNMNGSLQNSNAFNGQNQPFRSAITGRTQQTFAGPNYNWSTNGRGPNNFGRWR